MRTRTSKASTGGIATALIYTRVSGDEQEREGLSLPAQLADCRRYAQQHGWIIGTEFQDVMSGKRDDRPQYRALLSEVRRLRTEGQNAVVVVKWLHRFGRRVSERVRCWEELDALGVAIHSVAEGGVVLEVVANILASIAQEESRQIGERVSSTWRHVTGLGWAKTTTAPWGYRWRPATADERAAGSPKSVLDADSTVAPYAQELFERVAAGQSARSVAGWAARLPEAGRTTQRALLTASPVVLCLSWRSVQQILRSPVYAGRPVQGNPDALSRPLARWPALVADDVWQRAQDRIDSHRHMPRQASGKYLLTGLLRCPNCSGRMRGETMLVPRYRCGGVDPGTRCQQTADAVRVEHLVLAEVGAALEGITSDSRIQASLRRSWHARRSADVADDGQQVRRLEAQTQRARQRIARATELLVDGAIDRSAYDDLVAKARADAEAADTEMAGLRHDAGRAAPKLPPLAEVLASAGSWASVLEGADVVAQREVLAALIERVVAVRERYGVYRVELTWTPLGEALRATTAS